MLFRSLGSTLDLVESFLCLVYKILESKDPDFVFLENRDEFIRVVTEWFDSKNRMEYLKKVKNNNRLFAVSIFRQFPKDMIIRLGVQKEYGEFSSLAGRLRYVRNIFVHDMMRAKAKISNGKKYVPKTDVTTMSNYKRWSDVARRVNSEGQFKKDFGEIEDVAMADINELMNVLNALWATIWKTVGKELKRNIPSTSSANSLDDEITTSSSTFNLQKKIKFMQ